MTQGHEAMILEVLKRAVAEALERKRKLGQYAVVWRDGRVLCIGPDAPAASGVPSTGNPRESGDTRPPNVVDSTPAAWGIPPDSPPEWRDGKPAPKRRGHGHRRLNRSPI
jgi:hypothetical protein